MQLLQNKCTSSYCSPTHCTSAVNSQFLCSAARTLHLQRVTAYTRGEMHKGMEGTMLQNTYQNKIYMQVIPSIYNKEF